MASGFYALSGRHSRIVCKTIFQSISLKAQSQVVESISASTVMQFPIWSDSRLSRVMLNDHSHNATQIPFYLKKKRILLAFFTWNQTPAFPFFLLKKDFFIPFFYFSIPFLLGKNLQHFYSVSRVHTKGTTLNARKEQRSFFFRFIWEFQGER